MRGSCYFTYFALLAILFSPACQKKSPDLSPVPSAFQPPDEPVQNLAWQTASRIKKGFPDDSGTTFRLAEFTNPSALPASVLEYFRKALEKQLESQGLQARKDSGYQISGSLLRKEKQLIFSFAVSSPDALLLSDSASIPDDTRLRNTLAQFETPPPEVHAHREVEIPSPLLELEHPPLDVLAVCPSAHEACSLILLFPGFIEIRDWQKGIGDRIPLPSPDYHSRTPTGKLLALDSIVVVLTNLHRQPLLYDSSWKPAQTGFQRAIPSPEATLNSYVLSDGKFYDFELLPTNGIAVVDTRYRPHVALKGALASSDREAGGTLCSTGTDIYTSSPVPAGQPDAILKFVFRENLLTFVSSRPVDGDILDLACTDLNQDGKQELLATIRIGKKILIEPMEPIQ